MIAAVAGFAAICALVPAVMFLVNLTRYLPPPHVTSQTLPAVSILIPARNEALAIEGALRHALASRDVDFEIVVMDDCSSDDTAAVVAELADRDPRVRLEQAPALPPGWNGKQHACWALAQAARNPLLCFVDADVRLEPDCVARMAQFLQAGNNGLVSGFPRQVTGTFLEWMLLPLIHFVLLGFLPIARMRSGTDPSFAAGCGQFFLMRREDYFACGGHSGIKRTMHDGLRLPRLFREAGFRTDLADLTNLARCRMYTSAAQVWSGLAKNATEGLGAPARIVPITFLLLAGQVAPYALLLAMLAASFSAHTGLAEKGKVLPLLLSAVAVLLAWLPRILAGRRFKQSWRGVLLHPLGIVLLLSIQWYALLRKVRGGAVSWKDRAYAGD